MTVRINGERKGIEVEWDQTGDESVTVYAMGDAGDWHNTSEMPNDGKALLSYPAEFQGRSLVEVRAEDGSVIDTGEIEVS